MPPLARNFALSHWNVNVKMAGGASSDGLLETLSKSSQVAWQDISCKSQTHSDMAVLVALIGVHFTNTANASRQLAWMARTPIFNLVPSACR